MTEQEHLERHKQLHAMLDELVADYITCTGKSLTASTIMDLIRWSRQQEEQTTSAMDEHD